MIASLLPVGSLLSGVGLLLVGHGLLTMALPLRGEAEGFDPVAIGALGAAYYGGFVAGCLHGPRVIRRAGHIRAVAAVVCGVSAAAAAYPLAVTVPAWIVLRFAFGYGLAVFYLIVESWLNDRATNTTRGMIMSAYIMVNHVALTGGQLLLFAWPVEGFHLFVLGSVLISISAIPVVLTRQAQPAPVTEVRFRPGRLWRASPVGLVGSLMIGVGNGAFWSLGPVSATDFGLTHREAAIFMSVAVMSGALVQMPIGRVSDRLDRRHVLAVLLAAATGTGLSVFLLAPSGIALMLLGAAFGASALPGYSLVAAHAYDHADPSDYVGTASSLLLVNGLGSIVGPIAAAFLLRASPGGGLYLFTAATHGVLLGFVLWRVTRRAAPPEQARESFDLAATAPAAVGGVIAPEPAAEADQKSPAAT
ncbi:MFS transporter [Elioraea tepidiphila]|jgi:MFS family permease|uniref:MFS transporter n=1 Tax=Elioraea tepidiphila TaxID=457934 RepID=UPI00035CF94D|nr:MFS transporter [Elioraea tepidiphila]